MNYVFDSSEARQLNKDIFETIYHAALEESCSVAKPMDHIVVSMVLPQVKVYYNLICGM
jgi:hypothetical protein